MNKEVLYDLVNYLNPQTREYKGGRPQVEPDEDGSNDTVFSWKQKCLQVVGYTIWCFGRYIHMMYGLHYWIADQ